MLPFLIFLVAFGLTADVAPAAEATPTPDPHVEFAVTIKEIQDSADKLKGDALKSAAKSLKETSKEMREEAGESPTESPHAKNRHHDSNDEDMVFAAIPIVAIVFTFAYLIIRALMAPFTNRNKRAAQAPPGTNGGFSEEEVALVEKLHRTLVQMESRVESLETILIDQARTKEKYGTKL